MRSHRHPIIALLMLFVLATALGRPAFEAERLAHEFEHAAHASANHGGVGASGIPGDDSDRNDDPTHRLLHAVPPQLPSLINTFMTGAGVTQASERASSPHLLRVPVVEQEPPFRPPRFAVTARR